MTLWRGEVFPGILGKALMRLTKRPVLTSPHSREEK